MTAEANKAIVRRYIDELNQRNTAVLDELVADDFREAVRQGHERNVAAFPDYFVEIHDMVTEGEQVVVEWSHRGTHVGPYEGVPATRKVVTGRAISVYRVVNGKITDARGISDRGEIWQQLGLIPDGVPGPMLGE
jgi:steroid delta-isomerase-like uncharacterized protein